MIKFYLMILVSIFLLTGCGSGGGSSSNNSTSTLSGKVADGYISGAIVCIDTNSNKTCEDDEPQTISETGGNYELKAPNNIDISNYSIVVEVPVGAIDEDEPNNPITEGFTLTAPAKESTFISPISTLVENLANENDISIEEAKNKLKQKISISDDIELFDDYVSFQTDEKKHLHNIAKLTTKVMRKNHDTLLSGLVGINRENSKKETLKILSSHIFNQLEDIDNQVRNITENEVLDDKLESLNIYVDTNDLTNSLNMTEDEKVNFEKILTGEGSTLPFPQISPSCIETKTYATDNIIGGFSSCVELKNGEKGDRTFSITEKELNVSIFIKNIVGKTEVSLYKVEKGVSKKIKHRLSRRLKGWMVIDFDQYANLSKGEYVIRYKQDCFIGSSCYEKSLAKIEIISESNRIKRIGFLTAKETVDPYILDVNNTLTINGTLHPTQDYKNANWIDIIPLSIGAKKVEVQSSAKVSIDLKSSEELDVIVANAQFLPTIFFPKIGDKKTSYIWEGTSSQLKHQVFNLQPQSSNEAYYVILKKKVEPSSSPWVDFTKYDYVPYSLNIKTNQYDDINFSISNGNRYSISNFSELDSLNLIKNVKIKRQYQLIKENEFFHNEEDAKNLISSIQTLQAILSFDEGATLKHYNDYVRAIDGIDASNDVIAFTDELTSIAISFYKKDYSGIIEGIGKTIIKEVGKKTPKLIVQNFGKSLMTTGVKTFEIYINKKKALIKKISNDFILDTSFKKNEVYSELFELYILQERAFRYMKTGMDIYKSLTSINEPSWLDFVHDRIVKIGSSTLPSEYGIADRYSDIQTIKTLEEILKNSTTAIKLSKNIEDILISLNDDDKYFNFYDEDVQNNNSFIQLIEAGYKFEKDEESPQLSSTSKTFTTTVGTYLTLETVTANDNKDGSVAVSKSGTVDFNTIGTYEITYNAEDASGNTSSIVHTYSVTSIPDTTAPIITTKSSFAIDENKKVLIELKATDESDVIFSLSGKDKDSFILKNNWIIESKDLADYEKQKKYNITLIATDNSNNSSSKDITINVKNIVEESDCLENETFENNQCVTKSKVTSFSPNTAIQNEVTVFTVLGENLPDTIAMSLEGSKKDSCKIISKSSTEVKMSCIPSSIGLMQFYIKEQSGGSIIPRKISVDVDVKTVEEIDYTIPIILQEDTSIKSKYVVTTYNGEELYKYNGVNIYSNYDDNLTGTYQCTELIKRFYNTNFDVPIKARGHGKDVAFNFNGALGSYLGVDTKVIYYPNNTSLYPPVNGSIISFDNFNSIGHVAIVKKIEKIDSSTLKVYLAEQNWAYTSSSDNKVYTAHSRYITFTKNNKGIWFGVDDSHSDSSKKRDVIGYTRIYAKGSLPSISSTTTNAPKQENEDVTFTVNLSEELDSKYSVKIALGDNPEDNTSFLDPTEMSANNSNNIYTYTKSISVAGNRVYKVAIFDGDTRVSAWLDGTYIVNENTIPTDSIIHNNFIYGIVTSPITGKKWLDRNLGASSICTSVNDEQCFGDYYQWGRLTDGHEKVDSNTNSTLATTIQNIAHSDFITTPSDWASLNSSENLRVIQWSKTDGKSICPIGFRVPTIAELKAETIDYSESNDESSGKVKVINSSTAFKNFLKLSNAGYRSQSSGELVSDTQYGYYWSTTLDGSGASRLFFASGIARVNTSNLGQAMPIRCIADTNINPKANAGEDKNIKVGDSITLDASTSVDSDGSISSYEWRENGVTLSTETSFSKDDFSEGEHIITLIVTDNNGAKDFDTVLINVTNISSTPTQIVLKTGQTKSYTDYDDGYYQKGVSRSYTRGGDIVIDQITKLQWQDDEEAKSIRKTWEEAKTYCEDKNLGGHNDWRLPSIKELQTIVDDEKYSPSMNPIFENTSSNYYWSSTTNASNTSNAWYVYFNNGYTRYRNKTGTYSVRCVRAGQ